MQAGESRRIFDEMPDYTEQCVSETKDGCLSWLLAAMDFPTAAAKLHGYGTVIGTGNAVVSWNLDAAREEVRG